MATLLANIMTSTEGEIEGLEQIQPAIDAALQQYTADSQLLQAEAVMRASRGEYDQAIKLFRQIVEREPEQRPGTEQPGDVAGGNTESMCRSPATHRAGD